MDDFPERVSSAEKVDLYCMYNMDICTVCMHILYMYIKSMSNVLEQDTPPHLPLTASPAVQEFCEYVISFTPFIADSANSVKVSVNGCRKATIPCNCTPLSNLSSSV